MDGEIRTLKRNSIITVPRLGKSKMYENIIRSHLRTSQKRLIHGFVYRYETERIR